MQIRTIHLLLIFAVIWLTPKSTLFAKVLSASPTNTTAFSHQGTLTEQNLPANGEYALQFMLFDDAVAGSQIGSTIKLSKVSVVNGIFTVQIDFGSTVWNGQPRWLETWVNGTALAPRQLIGSVPYATYAQSVSWDGVTNRPTGLDDGDNDTTYSAGNGLALTGTQFNAVGVPYANVVIVAKSGGNFTTVGAALASINTASATNPYLIWVAPGVYTEIITMKSYVDVVGAGEDITVLTNLHNNSNNLPAIITGANAAALRSLTVNLKVNISQGGGTSIAIDNNATTSIYENVTVRLEGNSGSGALGIRISNGGAQLRNLKLYVTCLDSINYCTGISNQSSSSTIEESTIQVSGARLNNIGISNSSNTSPSSLAINTSTILAEGRNDPNRTTAIATGISIAQGASAEIRHSKITASGGTHSTYGIGVSDTNGVGQKQITINHSEITSSHATNGSPPRALRNSHLVEYTVRIGTTLLGGDVHVGIADLICVGTYNANYIALNSQCASP